MPRRRPRSPCFTAFQAAGLALCLLATAPALAQGLDNPRRPPVSDSEREYSAINADRAYRIGASLFRAGRHDEAVRQFERAVSLAPQVEAYRKTLTAARQELARDQARNRAAKLQSDRMRKLLNDENEPDQATLPSDFSPKPDQRTLNKPLPPTGLSEPSKPGTDDELSSDRPAPSARLSRPEIDAPFERPALGARLTLQEINAQFGTNSPVEGPTDLPTAGAMDYDLPMMQLPRSLSQPLAIQKPSMVATPEALVPEFNIFLDEEPDEPGPEATPALP